MKRLKNVIAAAGVLTLFAQPATADALKNSLSGMLHQKDETPSMVNLNTLGMSAAQPAVPKSRSSKAVVAIVDGHKVRKKEVDSYLKQRTKGKVSDFDLLPKEQQMALLKEIYIPKILAKVANKELTQEEKEGVLSSAWMQKAAKEVTISDEEIASAYERIKARAQAQSALAQVPPLEKIKRRIQMQLVEQKIIANLMRGVEVRVEPDSQNIAGYAGMLPISVEEANRALEKMTQGKMTWNTLPPAEKKRLLEMLAPNKLIALSAENDLSQEEKDTVYSNFWMQKQIEQTDVSDKEIKRRYAKIKKRSKKKVPSLEELTPTLKMQIAQEKVVESLSKKAHIKLK